MDCGNEGEPSLADDDEFGRGTFVQSVTADGIEVLSEAASKVKRVLTDAV